MFLLFFEIRKKSKECFVKADAQFRLYSAENRGQKRKKPD